LQFGGWLTAFGPQPADRVSRGFFMVFFSLSRNPGYIIKTGHGRFLSQPSQFVILQQKPLLNEDNQTNKQTDRQTLACDVHLYVSLG